MDGFNILADPILNSYCGPTQLFSMTRYRPAPCTVNELPRIDAVCISHDHYDHLDVKTVKELHQRFGDQLKWYVPNGLKSWMASCGCKNAVELEWWEEAELSKKTDAEIQSHSTVKFVFTPTQHWCRRSATDKNQVLWGSWTILGPKHRFFFAGDTGYCKGFKQIGKRFGPFDFAAIPIGAYKPRLGKSIILYSNGKDIALFTLPLSKKEYIKKTGFWRGMGGGVNPIWDPKLCSNPIFQSFSYCCSLQLSIECLLWC